MRDLPEAATYHTKYFSVFGSPPHFGLEDMGRGASRPVGVAIILMYASPVGGGACDLQRVLQQKALSMQHLAQ